MALFILDFESQLDFGLIVLELVDFFQIGDSFQTLQGINRNAAQAIVLKDEGDLAVSVVRDDTWLDRTDGA